MVHITDTRGCFDVPIDKIWDYLRTSNHGEGHGTSSPNQKREPLRENSTVISWDPNIDGKWVRVVTRITVFQPIGAEFETLEGPFAGSVFFNYYTPRGNKTEVTVVGEFEASTIPAARLEAAVRNFLEAWFEEDKEGLKHFAARE